MDVASWSEKCRGAFNWFVILCKLMGKDPTFHLIYYLNKPVCNTFMDLIIRSKFSSTQHDVCLVYSALVQCKMNNTARNTSGRDYLVIDQLVPLSILGFSVRFNQNILLSSAFSAKYGHFWLQINKMMTAVMPNLRLQNSSLKIELRWVYTSALSVGVCQIDDSCIELKAPSTASPSSQRGCRLFATICMEININCISR